MWDQVGDICASSGSSSARQGPPKKVCPFTLFNHRSFFGGGGCDCGPRLFYIEFWTCFCNSGRLSENRSGRACPGVGIVCMRYGAMQHLLACCTVTPMIWNSPLTPPAWTPPGNRSRPISARPSLRRMNYVLRILLHLAPQDTEALADDPVEMAPPYIGP